MKYLFSILFFVSIFLNIYQFNNRNKGIITEVKYSTDTLIVRDTVTNIKPIPKYINNTDTIFIPIQDGDSIGLEREEKTYSDDSTYNVVISGFKPQIEEITVYPRKIYITNEKTLEIERKRHFNYGLGLGVGMGLINKKPDIYVGFNIGYTF